MAWSDVTSVDKPSLVSGLFGMSFVHIKNIVRPRIHP
jgi:hypothetical protein